MLDLLDLKNDALEEFIAENDRFLKKAVSSSTSVHEFKNFYSTREKILAKINKIDSMIEKVCSIQGYDFMDLTDTRDKIISRQNVKRKLVTKIVDQDLLIMTMYAEHHSGDTGSDDKIPG